MTEVRVALLLSCHSFEEFFGGTFGLTRGDYVTHYRNDFAWDYAHHLRSVGIDLMIYVPTRCGPEVVITEDGHTVRFVPVSESLARLYSMAPWLARTPPGRWIAEVVKAVAMLPRLHEACRADGAGVLYVQEYWTGRFDAIAVLARLPVVGADHGGRPYRQLRLAKPLSFRRARAITVQSAAEAATVAGLGGQPVLLGNAVDTDFFQPAAEGLTRTSLLHVARLVDQQKRTSVVLAALAELPVRFTLDVVGEGPDRPLLEALAEELGVSGRVRFHGFVTDREALRAIYRTALAIVHPSAYEARLLVVLEAMACGTPAVVSDLPTFREIVEDGRDGIVVQESAGPDVARAVLAVERGGSTMRLAARAHAVDDHGWGRAATAFRRMIDSVNGGSGPDARGQRRRRSAREETR